MPTGRQRRQYAQLCTNAKRGNRAFKACGQGPKQSRGRVAVKGTGCSKVCRATLKIVEKRAQKRIVDSRTTKTDLEPSLEVAA